MSGPIRTFGLDDASRFQAHFERHRMESGCGDIYFMPFTHDDPDGPLGIDLEASQLPVTECGWQRWFVAADEHDKIVAHVDLRGDSLKAGLHRCELGIGIERPHRGKGLGRQLMKTAIEFGCGADTLAWIDLRVFAHNTAARALYRKLGFVEVGTRVDRFRIDGQQIDDVTMTLNVG